ncbi:PAS domain-containing sensor histidine kinase [Spirosoma flavum]|uniref:histidine kinase n=1 Tax=Spirosoma flavum TaxID=2048557 RepID=A0ABW6APC8_9BACT
MAARNERLSGALQEAHVGTWELDLSNQQLYWDEQCKKLYGFSQDDSVLFEQVIRHIHVDDQSKVRNAMIYAFNPRSGGDYTIHFRMIKDDDQQLHWLHCQGKAYFNQDGNVYRFLGIAQDVTQEMQTQQQLLDSEVRYQVLVAQLNRQVQERTEELGVTTEELSVSNEELAASIDDLVVANNGLQASRDRLQQLFEQAPLAIALVEGPNYILEIANSSLCALLGRTSVELVGKPMSASFPKILDQSVKALLDEVRRSGKPFVGTEMAATLQRDEHGAIGYYNFVYEPLREPDGIKRVLVVMHDVTESVYSRRKIAVINKELVATNAELTESNELLKRSNENLQQFAYIASHDLQEPLRKIQSFSNLLKSQYALQLGEGVTYLDRTELAASRMSTLIRDLLSFSRISIQRDTSIVVSLTDVVQTAINDLDLVIQDTRAMVEIGTLPMVLGDPSQLRQLFENLLSNALKFRQPDLPVQIRVTAHQVATSDLPASVKPGRGAEAYYRIDVSDNGIGFDQKYLDRIFQVFQRLHNKSQYAGTGIGLAICEKVALNHGGAITASSQPGKGATFNVYLPA